MTVDDLRKLPPRGTARLRRASMMVVIGAASGMLCGSALAQTPAGPGVTISAAGAARLGSTVQFTAVVTNTTNKAVIWQVNGVTGGSAGNGTISASGLYTPPAAIPNPNTVTVSAITQAAPAATASLAEPILNPLPKLTGVTATPASDGSSYNLDVIGTGFVTGAAVQVLGGSAGATTLVSPTELKATITVPGGALGAEIAVSNPDPGGSLSSPASVATVSLSAAARLLDQATFGPTIADIYHVQQVGAQQYLSEQFTTPPTLLPDIATPPPTLCTNSPTPCEQSEWWQAVITGPDQLRQRVAFALSEIFVVSTDSENARSITPYQNVLLNDAFTNFLTIMHDVTLSPAMGRYLNMLQSNKPAPGQIANENFGRELMQLFTTGLYLLNPDGTFDLDANGRPQPTYTEAQVEAFARAWTGWTYATATGGSPTHFPNNTANYDSPMAPVESAHDMTPKTLLLGTTLPAGQSAEQDLSGALANIFNHPNVGPFVSKQLIQHLVTSTPSPAYVARVAAVFANNGLNVRGDMKSVIAAILLDPEARAGDSNPSFDGGHLREPMLYVANAIRALYFANTDPNGYYNALSGYSGPLGEQPYTSPSVFNFFPPGYVIAGTTLNAPEFAQENTATAILRLSLANAIVNNRISGFSVDLSATSVLGRIASATGNATSDSGDLVDALGLIFMHGQMPAPMRSAIATHVAGLTDIGERVRVATYLVITSSEYKIEH